MTPCVAFGPYNADAGPRTNSILSISSLEDGTKYPTLTLKLGTPAGR